MAVKVVARERLQSGKKDAALEIFREMVELTRKEKGCIAYSLHESAEDPDVIAMIEAWESQEALKAHLESEHFKRLIPQVGALVAEPSRIEVFKELF
ncbi:MAG: antibiotic biosynthesis monooxygenase [Clostridiales Family XIII bacterium]|jgi:quinol monooxygenase YgiN|nr:antibiotic biosynthesis monooxygenase [Clostridiales Family XIII bacterium]